MGGVGSPDRGLGGERWIGGRGVGWGGGVQNVSCVKGSSPRMSVSLQNIIILEYSTVIL